MWCCRASAARIHLLAQPFFDSLSTTVVIGKEEGSFEDGLGWRWSSRTMSFWSIISASSDEALNPLAKKAFFKPACCSGKFTTSVVRPYLSSGIEGFAGPEASGFVPVFVHGCSVLNSVLRRGEEEGLGCNLTSFSKISIALYNPDYSTTSSTISCSDSTCAAAQTGPAVCRSGGLCGYSFTYDGDDIVTGYYVSDTMYFDSITGKQPSVNSSASVVFGCTKTPPRVMETDGVLGFGRDELSFVSQIHSQGLSPRVFSHCLDGSEKGGGIFALGKIVAPGVVYTPLVSPQSSYNLNLESIAVNGKKLPIDSSLFATSNSQGTTIVDSGTALAYIVEGAHGPLVSAIAAAIPPSVTPVDTRMNRKRDRHDKCFVSSGSMDLLFPTVTLYFKGDAAMTVKPSQYLVQTGTNNGNESVWCIGWQSSQVLSKIQGVAVTVLGDIVLHDRLIVYDLENKRLGWRDYNCSSFNRTSPFDVSGASAYYSGGLIWAAAVCVLLSL